MLRLEKTSESYDLAVRIREKECSFEPRVLKAFAAALFLHVGILLLIHITPFSFTTSFLFPPAHVQSHHFSQNLSVFTLSDSENTHELAPPPLTMIPSLETVSLSYESLLMPPIEFNPFIFQSLEERLWPMWQIPLSLELEEPRIQMTISGDLAELPLIVSDPRLQQMLSITPTTSSASISYQVQIDEITGEIFWFEPIQSSGINEVDQLTEAILLNLRFATPPSLELLRGSLHFVILIPNESKSKDN